MLLIAQSNTTQDKGPKQGPEEPGQVTQPPILQDKYNEGNNSKTNINYSAKDMLNKIFSLVSRFLVIKKNKSKGKQIKSSLLNTH